MIKLDDLLNSIPPTPTFKGEWASVYFEPMMGSEEQLTIVVAAIGKDGSCRVAPAIRPHVADVMFGAQATAFRNIVNLVSESLEQHLRKSISFYNWIPPVSGVKLSKVRDTSSSDLTGLLRQAVSLTASLAALNLESLEDEEVGDESAEGSRADQWPKLFSQAVIEQHPNFQQFFFRKFEVSETARPAKIFYLSNKVAINTGKLIPGITLSGMLERNKARLLDLLVVRDRESSLFPRTTYELVVFRPSYDDPTYSERQIDSLKRSLLTLEEAGDKHALRVHTVRTATEAAERIFLAEEVA